MVQKILQFDTANGLNSSQEESLEMVGVKENPQKKTTRRRHKQKQIIQCPQIRIR